MRRVPSLATLVVASIAAMSSAGDSHATCTTVLNVETSDYDPSDPSVNIMDSDTSPGVVYTTSTAVQAGAVTTLAQVSGSEWTSGCTPDDQIEVVYSATGSGTLPTPANLTSLTVSLNGMAFNGVGRTFGSTKEALELAVAMLSAKLLPSGVALSEAGGEISLTVDLEESWVSP